MNSPQVLVGAVEAGGTKFVCAVGTGPDDVRAHERFDTTLPVETIAKCPAFLQRFDGLAAANTVAAHLRHHLCTANHWPAFVLAAGWPGRGWPVGHGRHASVGLRAPRCIVRNQGRSKLTC